MDSSTSHWSLMRAALDVSMHKVEVGMLRVLRNDAGGAAALGKAFGFGWPVEPNTMAGRAVYAAWLGPGEWAIFGPSREVAAGVAKACADRVHHFFDMSAGCSLWRVSGSAGRDLLAGMCSLDLHPRAFQPGRCARTLFAQVPALIMKAEVPDEFRILADASFDGHLQSWLAGTTYAKTDFG